MKRAEDTERSSAEIAAAEREAQGLPAVIDDPVAYRDLATLVAQPTTSEDAA